MEKQTKIVVALLLATILAGLIIVIILMPSDIAELKETAKIDPGHPCQKAALDNFNMFKDASNIMEFYGVQSEEYKKFHEDFESRVRANANLFEVNNCETTQSEWVTPEFQKEMQDLLDEGF